MPRVTRILAAGDTITLPNNAYDVRLGCWGPGGDSTFFAGSVTSYNSGAGSGWSEWPIGGEARAQPGITFQFATGADEYGAFGQITVNSAVSVKAYRGTVNTTRGTGGIRFNGGDAVNRTFTSGQPDDQTGVNGGGAAGTQGDGAAGGNGVNAKTAAGVGETFTDSVSGMSVRAGRGGAGFGATSSAGESAGGGAGSRYAGGTAGGPGYAVFQYSIPDVPDFQPAIMIVDVIPPAT